MRFKTGVRSLQVLRRHYSLEVMSNLGQGRASSSWVLQRHQELFRQKTVQTELGYLEV